MTPFEALTQKDKENILHYIDWYGPSNENASHNTLAPISTLLAPWDENKKFLFNAFGNQLILEKEAIISVSEEEICNTLAKELCTSSNPFYHELTRLQLPVRFVTVNSLYTNKVVLPQDFSLPDGKKIRNGEKLMRALSKIAKAYNLSYFEKFRLQHSRILNKTSLSGTYCLSIHPIDYMTMSDSNYNWTSCMSWQNIGDYRQGTVEMMNSPYVVVGYLKGEHNLGNYNDKRWRSLFIASDNCIINIKGYPYQNDELSRFGVEWLSSLLKLPVENISNYQNDKSFEITGSMYNDFCDKSINRFINVIEPFNSLSFDGPSECMCCGSTSPYLPSEFDIFCENCEEKFWCEGCGERILNEICRDNNGYYYHSDCYNECYAEDQITEEEIERTEAIRIFLVPEIEKIAPLIQKNYYGQYYLNYFPSICTTEDSLNLFSNPVSVFDDTYAVTNGKQYFNDFPPSNESVIKNMENVAYQTNNYHNFILSLKEAINND